MAKNNSQAHTRQQFYALNRRLPVVRTIVKTAKNGILREWPPGSFLKNPLNIGFFSPLMYLYVTAVLQSRRVKSSFSKNTCFPRKFNFQHRQMCSLLKKNLIFTLNRAFSSFKYYAHSYLGLAFQGIISSFISLPWTI